MKPHGEPARPEFVLRSWAGGIIKRHDVEILVHEQEMWVCREPLGGEKVAAIKENGGRQSWT